jgi:hypothetical protein
MSDQVGTQILASTGLVGNGRYMQDVSGNLSGKFSYTAEFTLPNYVPASSPAAFVVPKALPSFNGVELFVDEIPQQSPKLPRLIVNGSRSESITIDFPDKTEESFGATNRRIRRIRTRWLLIGRSLLVHQARW